MSFFPGEMASNKKKRKNVGICHTAETVYVCCCYYSKEIGNNNKQMKKFAMKKKNIPKRGVGVEWMKKGGGGGERECGGGTAFMCMNRERDGDGEV